MKAVAAALVAALAFTAAQAEEPFAQDRIWWNKPAEPFHIIGPVYYVGTADLSVYLIETKRGLILLEQGLPESVPLIEANIEKLGFKLNDVKLMLAGHAHFDHVGGLAALQKATGAKVVASAKDTPFLEHGRITFGPSEPITFVPVKIARMVHDGETVSFGGVTLTAHLTPGHTPGDMSWTMPVNDNGTAHTVLFAGSLTTGGNPLINVPEYPTIAADFRYSFAKMRSFKADVLLTEHQSLSHEIEKAAQRRPGGANPFVDPGELARYVDASEKAFNAEYARQTGKN